MKVTHTWKGWDPYKWNQSDLKGWLKDLFDPSRLYSRDEAVGICSVGGVENPTLPKPKRCKVTITYEVE